MSNYYFTAMWEAPQHWEHVMAWLAQLSEDEYDAYVRR